jgi:hypothetical protein
VDLKLIFGIVSLVVSLAVFVPYLRDIFRKRTKPHAYSWLVWSLLQGVGVIAQFQAGAGYGAWGLTLGAFFCFTIFVLSLKFGTKNITKFDSACLAASLIAIVFYIVFKNPLWSIVLVSLIDFIGFLPTFRKAYQEPETETASAFALSALANFFSLLAIQDYSVTTVLYIASLVVTNVSFVSMLLIRKRILARRIPKTT